MADDIKPDLEPCPHCGPFLSQVELVQINPPYWQVVCGACGASSGALPEGDRWPNARQRIIDGWNARYYGGMLSAVREENKRLREALGFYADAGSWISAGHPQIDADLIPVRMDNGDRARSALIQETPNA